MLKPVRTVAPQNQLMTVAEIKAQARVDFGDDDALLGRLIDAATAEFDGWSGRIGRCLVAQTWRQDYRSWSRELRLPFPDVQSIAAISYVDANGASQTVSGDAYTLFEDSVSSVVRFKSSFAFPALHAETVAAISISFVAGYGADAAAVPEAIRHAAMMTVASWYENREGAGIVPDAADILIQKYRRTQLR